MSSTYSVGITKYGEGRMGVLTTDHAASSYGLPVLVIEGVAYGPSDLITLGGEPTPLRECLLSIRATDRETAPTDMDVFGRILHESEINAERDAAADRALAQWLGQ